MACQDPEAVSKEVCLGNGLANGRWIAFQEYVGMVWDGSCSLQIQGAAKVHKVFLFVV